MPPPRSQRRAQRARRRNTGSDLGARIAAAIPAIVFAIVIVAAGGLVWVAGLCALGIVCLHELFEMFDRAHPTRLGAFVGLIGMALAAHYGGREDLLLALMAAVPLTFLMIQLQPRG